MKYTYEISFNGSDYLDLYPNSDIEMSGEWESGTMIWRERISELKITKVLNSSVYDTLETYFEDSDYFQTRIFIKVLKNTVQDSLHWFGIKWGRLDKHLHSYVVEPAVYDLWGQHVEPYVDIINLITGVGSTTSYYGATWPYEYINRVSQVGGFHNTVARAFYNNSSLISTDIVSSLFNSDDDESGTPIAAYRGMPSDYVTGVQSFLYSSVITMIKRYSISDVIEWLKLFRCYVWFDDNDKLRYEHISYLNDKLTDNAVDFSSYIEDYHNVWQYENTDLAVVENISFKTTDEVTDDFKTHQVIYSDIRNRIDAITIDNSFQLFTDISYYSSDVIADELVLLSATENIIYELADESMDSFDSDYNYYDVGWNYSLSANKCGSNDIDVTIGQAYTYTVEVLTLTGDAPQLQMYFENRGTSAVISNTLTINTTGTKTGTFTFTASASDARLVLEGTSADDGASTGWILIRRSGIAVCPSILGVISGDVVTNGAFSVGNIFEAYWQDDRLSRSGVFNGDTYNFTSTQYNLKRDTIKFHYANVINPLYGFNDGSRIGRINKWTRSLETDFYEIDVTYQEDE